MAEESACESTRLESENEGSEDSGQKTSYLMDGGRSQRRKRGQPDDAISIMKNKKICSVADEEMGDGGFGNGDLYMPPWTINVVTLTGESSMESINIPQDVQTDAIDLATEQKFVSAGYANKLLKQIAGLAAIVKQRSHDARDLLSKHQQHTEWMLSHRLAEVTALRRELYQFRNKECNTQVAATRCTAPNYSSAGRYRTIEPGQSEPDNVNEMQQFANEEKIHATQCNSINTPSVQLSRARVHEGSKPHGQTNNPPAVIAKIVPYVPAEEQNLRIRRRAHKSVSERPENVIYASWKITRSE